MEFLSVKFGITFNSVQMVAYTPDGVAKEGNICVGMNWHADDEQYLTGPNKEHIANVAIATLNVFTLPADKTWFFNVRPKGIHIHSLLHTNHPFFIFIVGNPNEDMVQSFEVEDGDIYYQPKGKLFYTQLV